MVSIEIALNQFEKIRQIMKYDLFKDIQAAKVLNSLISRRSIKEITLAKMLRDKYCFFYGAGPNLESELKNIITLTKNKNVVNISADGATTALLKAGLIPDIITTDLDGRLEDLIKANLKGAILIIHAHGDNIDALKRYVPMFKGPIYGTCQVKPVGVIMNYGGYTDGDRGVFIAHHFGAKMGILIGWDFNGFVGKYSKPWLSKITKAWPEKLEKFRIATELLKWLREKGFPLYTTGGLVDDLEIIDHKKLSGLIGASEH